MQYVEPEIPKEDRDLPFALNSCSIKSRIPFPKAFHQNKEQSVPEGT